MALSTTRLTQQRTLLMSSFLVAILAEELLHGIVAMIALGNHLTLFKVLPIISKYAFAMVLADFEYGRIALSLFGLYLLPDVTEPRKSALIFTYLGAALLSALGTYFFNARYAVMFVGESFWLKPIFYQFFACVSAGTIWSSYCARALQGNDATRQPSLGAG